MKQLRHIFLLLLLSLSLTSFAQKKDQAGKDDKKEEKAERQAVAKEKVDYNLFHRQMLSLKEYSDERRRLSALKTSKDHSKIVAYVDSTGDAENNKYITGFIAQSSGEDITNLYEISFDRHIKKIVSVKPTQEAADMGRDLDAVQSRLAPKKAAAAKKKTADDDDEEEDEEVKPAKGKQKTKDADEE